MDDKNPVKQAQEKNATRDINNNGTPRDISRGPNNLKNNLLHKGIDTAAGALGGPGAKNAANQGRRAMSSLRNSRQQKKQFAKRNSLHSLGMNSNYDFEDDEQDIQAKEQQSIKDIVIKAKKIKTIFSVVLPIVVILLLVMMINFAISGAVNSVMSFFGFDMQSNNTMVDNNFKTAETRALGLASFATVIEDREAEWSKLGVQIDKQLVAGVLFMENLYNNEHDYNFDPNSLVVNENKKLADLASKLVDAMVEEKTMYYCRHYEVKTTYECDEVSYNYESNKFMVLTKVPMMPSLKPESNCTKKTETIYGDKMTCGYESSNCSSLCEKEYELTSELVYVKRTFDEYMDYLINNGYFDEILKFSNSIIPDNQVEKEKFYEKKVEAIRERYQIYQYYAYGGMIDGQGSYTSNICGITQEIDLSNRKSQCASWVYQRSKMLLSSDQFALQKLNAIKGNAADYYYNNISLGVGGFVMDSTPSAGSIAVYTGGLSICPRTPGGLCGHVIFIERVNDDGSLYVSECNYNMKEDCRFNTYTYEQITNKSSSRLTFRGFIHLVSGEC